MSKEYQTLPEWADEQGVTYIRAYRAVREMDEPPPMHGDAYLIDAAWGERIAAKMRERAERGPGKSPKEEVDR